ncbi:MAG: ribonuclease HII [archaeon]
MLVMGVDDAGRGPLIGPMILGGVLLSKDQERTLKEKGVADSKLLDHPTRMKLAKEIESKALKFKTVKVYPEEIDSSIKSGTNLNTLEAKKIAEVINTLNAGKFLKEQIKVIVDCPSINITAWRNTLLKFLIHGSNLDVVCEHKADFNHPCVSAASILAKVDREEEVKKIKDKYKQYGNTGSGYPSDPATKEFLVKHGNTLKDSGIFRKSWATWKSLFPEKEQATLGDFK